MIQQQYTPPHLIVWASHSDIYTKPGEAGDFDVFWAFFSQSGGQSQYSVQRTVGGSFGTHDWSPSYRTVSSAFVE